MELAVDFGTTNSVIAVVEEGNIRVISLPAIAREQPTTQATLVPTCVFVREKRRRLWPRFWVTEPEALIGQAALAYNFEGGAPGFAQSFKRALAQTPDKTVAQASGRPIPAREAAYLFLRELIAAARETLGDKKLTQLTISGPVGYFETYRAELSALAKRLGAKTFKTIDEPIAAALGYGVNVARDETLLVVDWGGGTLNLAVIRLGPGVLASGAAPILAKHMVGKGGDDVDYWLMEELLPGFEDIAAGRYDAKWEVMRAKESVSRTGGSTPISWRGIQRTLDRETLVALMTKRGLYDDLRTALTDIKMQLAESAPGWKVDEVLLTGGSTLLPEVPAVVDSFFPEAIVRHDNEFVFTAVASGAARFAGGIPVDDFIYHDYAIAVQEADGSVGYELLSPRRTRYPTAPDFAVRYYADYAGMEEMRFRVCEIGRLGQKPALWEPRPNGSRYWSPTSENERGQIVELNPADAPIALNPAGVGTSPRLRVTYHINPDRWLCMTVEDLVKKQTLRENVPVVRLR